MEDNKPFESFGYIDQCNDYYDQLYRDYLDEHDKACSYLGECDIPHSHHSFLSYDKDSNNYIDNFINDLKYKLSIFLHINKVENNDFENINNNFHTFQDIYKDLGSRKYIFTKNSTLHRDKT